VYVHTFNVSTATHLNSNDVCGDCSGQRNGQLCREKLKFEV